MIVLAFWFTFAACGEPQPAQDGGPPLDASRTDSDFEPPDSGVDAGGDVDGDDDALDADGVSHDADVQVEPLEIMFLGVSGFIIRHGDDAVLAAPLFTNPNIFDVMFSEVETNYDLIDRLLAVDLVSDVRAIISGHAHYDHLLDVPYVRTMTNDAMIYTTISGRSLLAGFAPDLGEGCEPPVGERSWPEVPRDRVVALNDPAENMVDYRMCQRRQYCQGENPGTEGDWLEVQGANVRIRAFCSSHPAQFLFVHYGEGCVAEDHCSPPLRPTDWLEGDTLAYLIDFLDETTREIRYRVFFQDAPTNAPVGHVHEAILAEKQVDVAILCVGTYDQVRDHPAEVIDGIAPRYVLLGHWEDFFRSPELPVQPLPFLDLDEVLARTESAIPPDESGPRFWLPNPGDEFEFQP